MYSLDALSASVTGVMSFLVSTRKFLFLYISVTKKPAPRIISCISDTCLLYTSKREVFYQSLRLIGDVLHTRPHTDSLIGFIDNQIAELQQRTKNQHAYPRVYVGGISYKGQKGLTSTDPYYAAFQFLGVDNVASSIDSTFVSPITGTFIDWEQLADWNPEVIFLDISGLPLIEEEFKSRKKANQLLTAYKNKQIYTLWPYNDSHSNFEVMLINAWYAGKVLFPNQFHDIIIREKADEIRCV